MEGQAPLPDNAIEELSSILQKEDLRLFEATPKQQQSSGLQVDLSLDATRVHVAVQMETAEQLEVPPLPLISDKSIFLAFCPASLF
jgi:hypothetical protein